MKRLSAVVAALALVLAACGDDDDQAVDDEQVVGESGGEDLTVGDLEDMQDAMENLPACDELYAEGNVLKDGQWQDPCTKEDGEVTFLGTASEECADGRKLLWNDAAWWFEGEGVHPHPPGSDANVPPETAYNSCGA